MSDARERALQVAQAKAIEQCSGSVSVDVEIGWNAAVEHHFEKCGTPTEPGEFWVWSSIDEKYHSVLVQRNKSGLHFFFMGPPASFKGVDETPPEHWLRVTWPEE